jgi:hypothetical protein
MIPSNLGSQFATLGANVRAFIDILTTFISNLGSNNKPKMLKVGPLVFNTMTPSVKGALDVKFIAISKSSPLISQHDAQKL